MKLTAYAPVQTTLAAASPATTALREKQAEAAREKLSAQKQALTTLRQQSELRKDEAKALAKKRVDQLKERLKMLEQLPGLDPAAKARLIAQITRELKSAVKAYASAGGTASETGTSTGSASSSASATDDAELSEGETATKETPDAPDIPVPQSGTEDSSKPATEDEATSKTATSPYDVAATRNSDERKSAEAKEDAEFARDVRDMMRKIKLLLDRAKSEATRDDSGSQEFKDADDALKALDDTLSSVESSAAANGLVSGLRLSLSV
ncbi:MAG: hypothetical protein QM645_06330 [Asticcacaulis sp.]